MLDHNGFGCKGMKFLADGIRRNPHLKGKVMRVVLELL
jgi:hypothetical protein